MDNFKVRLCDVLNENVEYKIIDEGFKFGTIKKEGNDIFEFKTLSGKSLKLQINGYIEILEMDETLIGIDQISTERFTERCVNLLLQEQVWLKHKDTFASKHQIRIRRKL